MSAGQLGKLAKLPALPALPAAWLAELAAQTAQAMPPARQPLWAPSGAGIGSIDPEIAHQICAFGTPDAPNALQKSQHHGAPGWEVAGANLSTTLNAIAKSLRALGLAGPWRDEQLAVHDATGQRLGSVERAAVRALGIATQAVHLIGVAPDGRHWVQRRSLSKANDPGLLDTLMGGMVAASDDLQTALARETWEEAGLRLAQLQGLRHGGQVTIRCASRDAQGRGYVLERIDWFVALLPQGLSPCNQDGEVDEFLLLPAAQVHQRLLAWEFTPEAAAVLIDMQKSTSSNNQNSIIMKR